MLLAKCEGGKAIVQRCWGVDCTNSDPGAFQLEGLILGCMALRQLCWRQAGGQGSWGIKQALASAIA